MFTVDKHETERALQLEEGRNRKKLEGIDNIMLIPERRGFFYLNGKRTTGTIVGAITHSHWKYKYSAYHIVTDNGVRTTVLAQEVKLFNEKTVRPSFALPVTEGTKRGRPFGSTKRTEGI